MSIKWQLLTKKILIFSETDDLGEFSSEIESRPSSVV
jgi:hypothetical protein